MTVLRRNRTAWIAGIAIFAAGSSVAAQPPPMIDYAAAPPLANMSLIYVPPIPPPPLIKVHDIITIEVDEKAEVIVNSRFNRQRNGAYTAALRQFIRFGERGDLENAATNSPSIEGMLQNRLQAMGMSTDTEGITYKIGATVVDVLPNGTLVLEARKTIRSNQDFFEYRLTGSVAADSIGVNRVVRTEKISNLAISRTQKGKIFDSTKVNWGPRVLDIITPF
jgi:flagellar L-ring protein precursor FlgH